MIIKYSTLRFDWYYLLTFRYWCLRFKSSAFGKLRCKVYMYILYLFVWLGLSQSVLRGEVSRIPQSGDCFLFKLKFKFKLNLNLFRLWEVVPINLSSRHVRFSQNIAKIQITPEAEMQWRGMIAEWGCNYAEIMGIGGTFPRERKKRALAKKCTELHPRRRASQENGDDVYWSGAGRVGISIESAGKGSRRGRKGAQTETAFKGNWQCVCERSSESISLRCLRAPATDHSIQQRQLA